MPLTEWTRIAVAGETVDGREIKPDWLTEAAANYNPELYTARISSNHIMGLSENSEFPAYGSITALKAEDFTLEIGGKAETKTGLYAIIDGNERLVEMVKKDQKIFSSIEVDDDFLGRDFAYIYGLAATDNPASIGTEKLKFSRQGKDCSNHISAPIEMQIKFASESEGSSEIKGLATTIQAGIDKMTALFASKSPETPPVKTAEQIAAEKAAAEAAGNGPENGGAYDAKFAAMAEGMTAIGTGIAALSTSITDRLDKTDTAVADLKKLTEETPEGGHVFRKPATGQQGSSLIM